MEIEYVGNIYRYLNMKNRDNIYKILEENWRLKDGWHVGIYFNNIYIKDLKNLKIIEEIIYRYEEETIGSRDRFGYTENTYYKAYIYSLPFLKNEYRNIFKICSTIR